MPAPWKESYDKPIAYSKEESSLSQQILYSQIYRFSSSHARMWELDHKEGWALKNQCFWTGVLEKILESDLGSKEIKPVTPKGNKLWIFIGRTDAQVKLQYFSYLIAEREEDGTTLMTESEEELKSLLMKVKGQWKSWLKTRRSKNWDHGILSHYFMANRWGNNGNSDRLYFEGLQKSLQIVTAAMKLKDACSLEEKLWPT